ncbi:MAG: tetratricopeptide repeat protein [Vampirovibrionales bacterium]|nr:tetratricopeptide repeat protein [Vampirovibrionales bacterium]
MADASRQYRSPATCRTLLAFILAGTLAFVSVPIWALETDAGVEIVEHTRAAQGYMQARQWDFAALEWRKALALNPKSIVAITGLADAMKQAGFIDDAIAALSAARTSIQDVTLDLALADAYMAKPDARAAGQLYRDVLKGYRFNLRAFEGLAKVAATLPEDERKAVEQALAKRAGEARLKGKAALNAQAYQNAVRYYEVAAMRDADLKTRNDFALALLLAGQNGRAREVFESLKTGRDPSWLVYSNAAIVNLSLGKAYLAQRDMETAIGLCVDPLKKAELYNNLGFVYENALKATEAKFAYMRALELNPKLTRAKLNLVYAHQKLMEYEDAIALCRSLTRQERRNAVFWNELGYAYELAHDNRQALAAYQRATQLNPNLEKAYLNLGMLYKKMQKPKLASRTFQRMMGVKFSQIEQAKGDAAKAAPSAPANRRSSVMDFVSLYFLG